RAGARAEPIGCSKGLIGRSPWNLAQVEITDRSPKGGKRADPPPLLKISPAGAAARRLAGAARRGDYERSLCWGDEREEEQSMPWAGPCHRHRRSRARTAARRHLRGDRAGAAARRRAARDTGAV